METIFSRNDVILMDTIKCRDLNGIEATSQQQRTFTHGGCQSTKVTCMLTGYLEDAPYVAFAPLRPVRRAMSSRNLVRLDELVLAHPSSLNGAPRLIHTSRSARNWSRDDLTDYLWQIEEQLRT